MTANEAGKDMNQKPVILALDTSSRFTSVSLARACEIVVSFGVRATEKRSERLWSEIEFLLGEAEMHIQDVDVIAVCVGPGGFTGIRVGVAAAKGLARATGKPVVGVTSLEAAALTAAYEGTVCVLMNAYRGDVYSQLFRVEQGKLPEALNEPEVGSAEKMVGRAAAVDRLVLAGDWVEQNGDRIERILETVAGVSAGPRDWNLAPYSGALSNAVALAGLMKHRLGYSGAPASLTALYVRPSEAEIKLSQGLVGEGLGRRRPAKGTNTERSTT